VVAVGDVDVVGADKLCCKLVSVIGDGTGTVHSLLGLPLFMLFLHKLPVTDYKLPKPRTLNRSCIFLDLD